MNGSLISTTSLIKRMLIEFLFPVRTRIFKNLSKPNSRKSTSSKDYCVFDQKGKPDSNQIMICTAHSPGILRHVQYQITCSVLLKKACDKKHGSSHLSLGSANSSSSAFSSGVG